MTYISARIAALIKKENKCLSGLEKYTLSETEMDFLKLACSDLAYKEIAGKQNLSLRSVENYREGLFEKLGVQSRVGLAVYAIKNGIVGF